MMFSRSKPVYTAETIDIMRLIRSENVGTRTFYSLVKMFGSATKALEKVQEMSLNGGRQKPIKLCAKADVARELDKLSGFGAGVLTYADDAYPKLLKYVSDAPPVISYLGNKSIFSQRFCSIVGARNASLNGQNFASNIAKQLSQNNINVVSGLARGIDTAAHKASIPNTVAVIAGGLDHIYPPENAKLFQEIAEKGAIIAELPIGSVPLGQHFPQRNRIISGMAMVTLVVEASLKSGSLITARMALEQGREVCAVPGFPMDPRCQGTNKLIKDGAALIESFEDVMTLLNQSNAIEKSCLGEKSIENDFVVMNLDGMINLESRVLVLEALSSVSVSINDIQKNTDLPLPVIYTILLELELAGKIVRATSGGVVRVF